jgi:hypothetical protein
MSEKDTIELERIPVDKRLPILGRAVLVETLHKTRYVAARFEVRPNVYAYGLVFGKKIIGRIESVAYWFEGV